MVEVNIQIKIEKSQAVDRNRANLKIEARSVRSKASSSAPSNCEIAKTVKFICGISAVSIE